MKILGIDTSTRAAGVAVCEDIVNLAVASHESSARSSDLLVTIDDVCRRANVTPLALDAIAVGAGPGSFTGLRIGMATAKGIAFAGKKPLWAVSSLAAIAFDGWMSLYSDGSPNGVYVGVLDGRRSEVFAGCYLFDAVTPSTLLGEERVMPPAELAAWVRGIAGKRQTFFAGDAIDVYLDVLAPLAGDWLAPRTPSGVAVAQLARHGAQVDILTSGTPTYIRPSEAEVLYPDGVPGALRKP